MVVVVMVMMLVWRPTIVLGAARRQNSHAAMHALPTATSQQLERMRHDPTPQ